MKKIQRATDRVLFCPVTPFACLLLAATLDGIILACAAKWLVGPELVIGLLGLASAVLALKKQRPRRIAAGLMALVMLAGGIGLFRSDRTVTTTADADTRIATINGQAADTLSAAMSLFRGDNAGTGETDIDSQAADTLSAAMSLFRGDDAGTGETDIDSQAADTLSAAISVFKGDAGRS